ncbi:MAG: helix-turn-helix transcriptional regulator [Oscillospiraceae bacterium]|nr:helix-turn-helix transcriptional regulator [Oscillospiraceae bacterium]
MNQTKIGNLIKTLRQEQNLTQKQLAELLHVSDKAVSKWETGNGCPDISLFPALSEVFHVNSDVLLSGEIIEKESEIGNMKKIKFYVCPECGNLITSTSEAAISCCGKKLNFLTPQKAEENQKLTIEHIDGELFLSSDHEMTKEHYISFVAYLNEHTMIFSKQYPEWNLQERLPFCRTGRLIWYCKKCGLLYQNIQP